MTRIEFDLCPSEEAARCREELLIGVLTPRYNAAGKVWPRRFGEPLRAARSTIAA